MYIQTIEKKKTTKQVQVKKSVAEPSTVVINEKIVDKINLESHSKPIPEKQRQEPKVSIKRIFLVFSFKFQ